MTDANPNPQNEWRNLLPGDPYAPPDAPPAVNPFAQVNIPVVILDEEDNSEEEIEEIDPDEDSEEYMPYGYADEHDSDSDTTAEEIPQDAQGPVEVLTDNEITPPTPSPGPMLCCPEGNCPLTQNTVRTTIPPATLQSKYSFATLFSREPQPYRHYEVGGTSQASPPAVAPTPPPAPAVAPLGDAPTMAQHQHVVSQVRQLRDLRTEDFDEMQTLHSQVGSEHSYATTVGAHVRAIEYRLEIAEQELRAAVRESLQLRRELSDLTRDVRRRLG